MNRSFDRNLVVERTSINRQGIGWNRKRLGANAA